MRYITPRRWTPSILLAASVLTAAALHAQAGEHPRLLLNRDELPRFRHACGLATIEPAARGWGRFGAKSADYLVLRRQLSHGSSAGVLPGELVATAFLHLMEPNDAADRDRLQRISAALQSREGLVSDPLEIVLALDWCWADLDPSVRHEFILDALRRAEVLRPTDSPLQSRGFRDKLTTLALALAVDETDEPSPSWLTLRTRVLEAGRAYFETTFPAYVAFRRLSPTGSAVGPREESDTALAIELGGHVLGRDLWPEYRSSVGRWMEHYVFATLDHPALAHHFIRDDGNHAPLTSASAWRDMLPVTAHLIAARTQNPAAALVAQKVEQAMQAPPDAPLASAWRWVPIVLNVAELPACDPARLPAARNFDGTVVFRGGQGPLATAIWVDTGQPFLRRRQHFDAGHFLIRRGGELAVDSGDDVVFEAVESRGGSQHLGRERESFDFEQYFTSTIAHNCLVVWDGTLVSRWYGKRYRPLGGQRLIEGTCTDFMTLLETQRRQTGRLVAYGFKDTTGYAAIDLMPAYESRALTAYTREFIFLWERALVVVDRVTTSRARLTPTWILNVPSRPRADGRDLHDLQRVAGATNAAGIWRCDDANWLRWTDRDGSLWCRALLPAPKCLRVVGGPARKLRITAGKFADRRYVGGDSDGYERCISPAERHGALNAWYRLGQPNHLGPAFGRSPHWGRLELEPTQLQTSTLFLTVLITDRADADEVPVASVQQGEETLTVHLQAGDDRALIRLPTAAQGGGSVAAGRAELSTWTLPTEVMPDPPLPCD